MHTPATSALTVVRAVPTWVFPVPAVVQICSPFVPALRLEHASSPAEQLDTLHAKPCMHACL